MNNIDDYSLEELKQLLLINCKLLTTIQKEKCLIKCFNHFEPIYNMTREESIKQYNLSSECTFLINGKKCNKKSFNNRLCKVHNKY